MAKISDTKIPITDFLEAYKRQPCLYNTLLDTYKNRVSREEAYQAIIKTLKLPQLTSLDIKLKIKSVRTVYTKELRILMREKELGRAYEPKLFWFKLADSFLRSVSLSHCKRLKNINMGNAAVKKEMLARKMDFNVTAELVEDAAAEEESDGEHLEDSFADLDEQGANRIKLNVSTTNNESNCVITVGNEVTTTALPRAPNKTELIIDDSALCIMEQSQQQAAVQRLNGSSVNNNTEDELIIFGQSIASQLRSISDPYSRSVAKLRIQQVLFEAETGQFNSTEPVSPHLHTF